MSRDIVLRCLARHLSSRMLNHPLRVGIDGVCGAGKSRFAADLALSLCELDRPVIHVDSDGFHHRRAIRYQQGRHSARGYYEDAYDFDSLRDLTLRPLGPGGSLRYASRVHDMSSDDVIREWGSAPVDAVVLFDATFIQRGDLRDYWDEVVFLDTSLERAQARGVSRDAGALGGAAEAAVAYRTRYMAACRMYLAEENPKARASIVLDHDDPLEPHLVTMIS